MPLIWFFLCNSPAWRGFHRPVFFLSVKVLNWNGRPSILHKSTPAPFLNTFSVVEKMKSHMKNANFNRPQSMSLSELVFVWLLQNREEVLVVVRLHLSQLHGQSYFESVYETEKTTKEHGVCLVEMEGVQDDRMNRRSLFWEKRQTRKKGCKCFVIYKPFICIAYASCIQGKISTTRQVELVVVWPPSMPMPIICLFFVRKLFLGSVGPSKGNRLIYT